MQTTRRSTPSWPFSPSQSLLAPAGASAQEAPEQPNLVVVMTDDQTVEELEAMPLTRRLLVDQGRASGAPTSPTRSAARRAPPS